jgi:hypothetical protein
MFGERGRMKKGWLTMMAVECFEIKRSGITRIEDEDALNGKISR